MTGHWKSKMTLLCPIGDLFKSHPPYHWLDKVIDLAQFDQNQLRMNKTSGALGLEKLFCHICDLMLFMIHITVMTDRFIKFQTTDYWLLLLGKDATRKKPYYHYDCWNCFVIFVIGISHLLISHGTLSLVNCSKVMITLFNNKKVLPQMLSSTHHQKLPRIVFLSLR